MTANLCDFCLRELTEDDGAICVWCADEVALERGVEWWAEDDAAVAL